MAGLNPKKTVAIDIGSSTVKAVQLKRAGRGFELEHFGVAELYPGSDRRSSNLSLREARIEATQQALLNAGISAKHAVAAVSGESIIVRYIQLPDMPENELKGAIRWEAEDYIPFPINEVYLDSVLLGRSEAGKMEVLLVAAKKEVVADANEVLKACNLQPAIVDIDSFAFLNCFEANYSPNPSEVIALINIGSETTNLNIFLGGSSRFCRDIFIAGDSISYTIQQRANCTFSRAEELKIKEGAPQEIVSDTEHDMVSRSSLLDTIRGTVEKITGEELNQDSPEFVAGTVIKQALGQLTNEIKRSIQFYENQGNGRQVARVVIGGGTSSMKNLDSYLCQELKLPVEVLDPLRNIGFAGNAAERKRLEKTRHLLGVSIGLGLRVFD